MTRETSRWLIAIPAGPVLGFVDDPDGWSALRKARAKYPHAALGVAPWQSASQWERDEAVNLNFRLRPTA